jgi:hypothetical protein
MSICEWLRSRVTKNPDIFQSVLILSFLYGIKLTLILGGEKSRKSTTCRIFNTSNYNFM